MIAAILRLKSTEQDGVSNKEAVLVQLRVRL